MSWLPDQSRDTPASHTQDGHSIPCADTSVLVLVSGDHSCWAATGWPSSALQHLSPVATYDGTSFVHLRLTEENLVTDQAAVQPPIDPGKKRRLQETPLPRSEGQVP